MTTKRIRCSCGRVYDPVKRPVCPDCGAPHVAAEPAVDPGKEASDIIKTPSPEPAPIPHPINPRSIAIGGGVFFLLVIITLLSRCGSKEDSGKGKHSVLAPSPTATATATAVATPIPSATALATPPPPPIVTPSPSGSGAQIVPSLTSDLSAMIAKAEAGTTIKVPPGVYPGGLVITKAVRLVGAAGQVFIQSDGRECLSVRAPGVAVQNIQFSCNGIGELPAISIADGAELELEGCKVQSSTAVAATATGNAALKTLGCSFTAANGVAVRLTNGARANFAQSSFNESRIGIWLAQAATAELHSCAFERDGGEDAKGSIIAVNNAKSALTADDCHFNSNTSGIAALGGATLTITNCSFTHNGITSRAGGVVGLVALYNNSTGTLKGDVFEANQQGVAVGDGSKLEIAKCQFSGTGVQMRDVIPSCQPISAFGKEAVVNVRDTTVFDSVQYGVLSLAGGKVQLEGVEISGTRSAGLVVGDRTAGAGEAQIKHCRFRNNGNGIGVFAASFATVEDTEFRENQDGIIVLDKESRLRGTELKFIANRDVGLFVHSLGDVSVTNSDFQNNTRGAVAGVKGKSAEHASMTLEDCRFSGSRAFAVGACAQSAVTLARCTFDGTDKLNVYKERSATVQMDAAASPSPSPSASSSPGDSEASPSPTEEQPGVSPSPSPGARSHSRPKPRSHRPVGPERILRDIFGPR